VSAVEDIEKIKTKIINVGISFIFLSPKWIFPKDRPLEGGILLEYQNLSGLFRPSSLYYNQRMGKTSIPLFICLFFVPAILACQKAEKKSGATEPASQELRVEIPKLFSPEAPKSIKVKGVFVPSQQVKLKSEFGGRLEDLTVLRGQAISAGDILLRIVNEDLPQKLDRLRTELQVAEGRFEQSRRLALAEGSEVEREEEEEFSEVTVEEPDYEFPRRPESAFAQLASEISFTPVDAGGVWPEVDPRIIARANDPQDAGGIWPKYGEREMVTGRALSADQELPLLMASLPNPLEPSLPVTPRTVVTQVPTPLETPEPETTPAATEFSEAENRLSLDQAKVDLLRADLALAESEFSKRTLLSPIEGRVHDLAASDGSLVEAGDFLMEIYQVDPIEFRFDVSKDEVGLIEVGMKIKGSLLGSPDLHFEGEINFIGPELNEDNQTVAIRARVDNANYVFRVGMKGAAEVPLKK